MGKNCSFILKLNKMAADKIIITAILECYDYIILLHYTSRSSVLGKF